MIVALFVVAFAMIVGGAASVYDGYAIVAVEKGWTKVIAGTVAGSAGVVLMGIVVTLVQLKRIGADLALVRAQAGRLDAPLPAPPLLEKVEPGVDETPVAPAPGADMASASPSPGAAMRDEEAAPPPEPPGKDRARGPQAPKAAADPSAGGEAQPRQAAPKEAPRREPAVVGTYASGGNTYVMYSDGSIRAETPSGLYRFDSLDELKAFIAAGGEAAPPAR